MKTLQYYPYQSTDLVIGFDFGTKRIGVAVGQFLTKTASPERIIAAQDGIPEWKQIEELRQQWKPTALVVGLPLNMDGTEQELTLRARKFANRLYGRLALPVHLTDERLTTREARDRINTFSASNAYKPQFVDSAAAALILESWFSEWAIR